MSYQDGIPAKLQKLRQYFIDFGVRKYHIVIDACKLLDLKRNGHVRIHKGAEFIRNDPINYLYRSDFDDPVSGRTEPSCLDIKYYIGVRQALVSGFFHKLL